MARMRGQTNANPEGAYLCSLVVIVLPVRGNHGSRLFFGVFFTSARALSTKYKPNTCLLCCSFKLLWSFLVMLLFKLTDHVKENMSSEKIFLKVTMLATKLLSSCHHWDGPAKMILLYLINILFF